MRSYLFIWPLLIPAFAHAQGEKIGQIETQGIRYATVDRAGNFYITTQDSLAQYDPDGNLLKKLFMPGITSFDTGNGVRLLAFEGKTQRYTILSPSFNTISAHAIDPSFAIDPALICSSGDYNILILDIADWSLKKVDVRLSQVLTDFNIDTAQLRPPDFIFMREYQNFIFLLDRQAGIMIYNSIGQHLQTIPAPGVTYFNFLGEELYYYKDNTLFFVDLFTGTERRYALKDASCRLVVLTDQRLYAVTDRTVTLFRFSPAETLINKD